VTEKLLLVVSVTTLCMLSPGPDMMLVMRNTLTHDRRWGGVTALGILTGNLVHIAYCTVGIALLLARSAIAFNALRLASAGYLVYLGVQSLRSVDAVHAPPAATASGSAYWQGFVNNVLNPKGSLFYLGVFSQLITPDMSAAQTISLVAVMMTVSALFWLVFVQALRMPIVLAGLDRSRVAIDRVFGVVLILFAAIVVMVR
jgi:threonine/homoserine/homoserine lactone efflux protein